MLKQPGNFFFLTETSLFGTNPEFQAKGVRADLDGDGKASFGEAVPDADWSWPSRATSPSRRAALDTAARAWTPDARGRPAGARDDDADDERVLRPVEELALHRRREGRGGRLRRLVAAPGHRGHPLRPRPVYDNVRPAIDEVDPAQAAQTGRDSKGLRASPPACAEGAGAAPGSRPSRPTPSAPRHSPAPRRSPARSPRPRPARNRARGVVRSAAVAHRRAGVAGALAAAGPAAAAGRALAGRGARSATALFDAQSALLLDDDGAPTATSSAPRHAYAGPLRTGFDGPTRQRTATILGGLATRAPARKRRWRSPPPAAPSRRRSSAAPRQRPRRGRAPRRAGGAIVAAAARVPHAHPLHPPGRRRHARTARARARPDPTGAARLAVVKDLLDATQGRVRERVDEMRGSASAGSPPAGPSSPRSSRAPGRMLAPRYADERGGALRRGGGHAAIAALRRAALRERRAARRRGARRRSRAALSRASPPRRSPPRSRRAAPTSSRSSSRSSRSSTTTASKTTRVTIPFEIQEGARVLRRGAGRVRRPPGRPARSTRATGDGGARLDELDAILRGAQERPARSHRDDVEDKAEAIGELLAALSPDAWEEAVRRGRLRPDPDLARPARAAGRGRPVPAGRADARRALRDPRVRPGAPARRSTPAWPRPRGADLVRRDDRPGLAELVAGRAPRKEVRGDARRCSTRSSRTPPRRLATARPRPRSSRTRRSSSSARASRRC